MPIIKQFLESGLLTKIGLRVILKKETPLQLLHFP